MARIKPEREGEKNKSIYFSPSPSEKEFKNMSFTKKMKRWQKIYLGFHTINKDTKHHQRNHFNNAVKVKSHTFHTKLPKHRELLDAPHEQGSVFSAFV